ncbi:MAG: hypothetical protein ACRD2C_06010 [Acidimicrobiales bacterium]
MQRTAHTSTGRQAAATVGSRGPVLLRLVAAVLVLLALGLVAFLQLREDGASGSDGSEGFLAPGGPPPPEVVSAVEALAAGPQAQRDVLSPGGVEVMAAGEGEQSVLPPGSRLRLDDDGWRSEIDGFGGAMGILVLPEGEQMPVEVGFVDVEGEWLVSYVFAAEVG